MNHVSFFVAQARQAPSCLHEMVFVGRKNMEHDSAEWSRAKLGRDQPTQLNTLQHFDLFMTLIYIPVQKCNRKGGSNGRKKSSGTGQKR